MRRSILLAAFVSVFAVAVPAHAAPCPGVAPWVFDDVQDTDPFCPSITWMAEHGITLGCAVIDANHRLFCPADSVRRDQMAAFVSRLGNISVPTIKRWGNFVSDINPGSSVFVFAGNTASVTVPAGETRRVSASASAAMGLLGFPVPIGADVALCWQEGANPLNSFNSQAQTVVITKERMSYSVSDSVVLFAGTYNIGMCVLNASATPISNNDRMSGWLLVTN